MLPACCLSQVQIRPLVVIFHDVFSVLRMLHGVYVRQLCQSHSISVVARRPAALLPHADLDFNHRTP